MIKQKLKSLKRFLRNFHHEITWNHEAKSIAKIEDIEHAELFNNLTKTEDRVLVVAPHPDDELIGCFSILNMYKSNADIYYTGLTGYDISDTNRTTRRNELHRLANYYKSRVYEDIPGEQTILCELLKKDYSYVFVPSYIDWHWEHRSTCKEVIDLVQKNSLKIKILLYAVTVPMPSKFVTHYSLTEENKWHLFLKYYPSQSFMPIKRFMATEKSYSLNCGIEPYKMLTEEEIELLHRKMEISDGNKYNFLEEKINDLIVVRKYSLNFYDELFEQNSN